MDNKNSVCEINIQDTGLKTDGFCRTCRYHKKDGQFFKSDQLFPRGFCPHAYRTLYPHALALLYNAQYTVNGRRTRQVTVKCPGDGDYIEIKLSVEYLYPKLLRMLKDAAVRFVHRLNISAEYPDKNVIIEVADVHGRCRFNLRRGSTFRFNLFNRKELCPASFYALYPVIVSPSEEISGNGGRSAHCPDPLGASYHIQNRDFSCAGFLKAIHKTGIDDGICPLALYAAFPYYWTYIHGGKFDWVQKNERVTAQCPHTNGIVMEIELIRQGDSGEGAVRAEIIKADGHCAFGYAPGDSFVLDSENQKAPFEHMINSIALFAAVSSGEKEKAAP